MAKSITLACAVPQVTLADPQANAGAHCACIRQAAGQKADILLFPELSLTGATCGDVFFQKLLHNEVLFALRQVLVCSREFPGMIVALGLPLLSEGDIYNCTALIQAGRLLRIIPKRNLSHRERRWFCDRAAEELPFAEFGNVSTLPSFHFDSFHVQVAFGDCPENPAHILLNPAAEEVRIGNSHPIPTAGIYVKAAAGAGESTASGVYSGVCLIAQGGDILQRAANTLVVQQLCLKETVAFAEEAKEKPVSAYPFLPEKDTDILAIFLTQAHGLAHRLEFTGSRPVLGVSGGLDSALALLVCAEAAKILGQTPDFIHAITMPGFGTTERTHSNGDVLMKKLGVTRQEIPIEMAVLQHFRDIGHDPRVRNAVYENAQARERTQILMDYAARVGGIVVGTGDMSELALGWCTYNGDHMSMYAVNSGIPKTLIPPILKLVSDLPAYRGVKAVLQDIMDTPISPELLPPDTSGRIAQQTEDLVGPYALHDFYLYHFLKGRTPREIYTMACTVFAGEFDAAAIVKWLRVFYKRFFSQQFKRSCQPEGVQPLALSLSPANAVYPGDMNPAIFLRELEEL